MTYGDLVASSAAFAGFLQSLGLRKGDRLALVLPNTLTFPVAFAGAMRAGLIIVCVNPLYTAREMEHQLRDAAATAVLILENFAHVLQQVIGRTAVKHVVVTTIGDMMGVKGALLRSFIRHVRRAVPKFSLPGHYTFRRAIARTLPFLPVDVSTDDIALLQYTGGTTGRSKGAILTHGNLLSNIVQTGQWAELAYSARGRPLQVTYICALPLYHIFSLTVNLFTSWKQGGHSVLVPNPRDIPALVKILKRRPWHFLAGLNTLFNALLQNDEFHKLDFSKVKLVMGGGTAVQGAVAERWQAVTGTIIYQGYGLSETSPVVTANPFNAPRFSSSVGLPLPSTQIAIRNEFGADVERGEPGEIYIRGPQVMQGYWRNPEETAQAFSHDGYFRSGDIGKMDKDGHLYLVDRKKDLILVSGFNVYPNEIEEVAVSHHGVFEAAAIGVPDEKSGESVKLFVVLRESGLSMKDLSAHCAKHLTAYKRPKEIIVVESLPKSPIGKILRRELRSAHCPLEKSHPS
ncbi:AMP-binding protein [Tabrizicola piscis]|nr:AMP-binding protein [Tabrizicola piscis]